VDIASSHRVFKGLERGKVFEFEWNKIGRRFEGIEVDRR
jgi:hypothetical protein